MVGKERLPAIAWITVASKTSQIPGHCALAHFEAELQKLSMNSRCTPVRIFYRHGADESPKLLADFRPTITRPGAPTPVQAEAHPMPSDDGLGFHDYQNIGPSWPELSQRGPEETVKSRQWWPWPLAFQHSNLLPQGEDLKRRIEVTSEEGTDGNQKCEDQIEHETTFVTPCNAFWWRSVASDCKLLI